MSDPDTPWLRHIGPKPGTRHRRHCFLAGFEAGWEQGTRETARLREALPDAGILLAVASDLERRGIPPPATVQHLRAKAGLIRAATGWNREGGPHGGAK